MIKVELERYNTKSDHHLHVATHQYFIENKVPNYIKRPNYNGGWFVKDPLHSWLVEKNIDYTFSFSHDTRLWYLGFEKAEDAMVFKLSWELWL